MDDFEYVKRLGEMYRKVLDMIPNDSYVVNQSQMDRFIEVADFWFDMAKKLDGDVKPVRIDQRVSTGDLIATFVVFDITGDDIVRFCNVMRNCSAIGIDANVDGEVCISCTVPNVFVPIK